LRESEGLVVFGIVDIDDNTRDNARTIHLYFLFGEDTTVHWAAIDTKFDHDADCPMQTFRDCISHPEVSVRPDLHILLRGERLRLAIAIGLFQHLTIDDDFGFQTRAVGMNSHCGE
jgi:hypothetical protein